MPYIAAEKRAYAKFSPQDAGELNYAITSIINRYFNDKGRNYARINEAIGALECAKIEMYRRIAAPYEDKKIAENGDVYGEAIGL